MEPKNNVSESRLEKLDRKLTKIYETKWFYILNIAMWLLIALDSVSILRGLSTPLSAYRNYWFYQPWIWIVMTSVSVLFTGVWISKYIKKFKKTNKA
ncbi:hypothetical protein ACFU1R_24980 [Priestia megaterium]|uniref:hypothetical protein n=1 Tax=Priestia megaterium TaxID=1404 RepID=UPI00366E7B2D